MAIAQDTELLNGFRIDLTQDLRDRFQTLSGLAQMTQMLDVIDQGLLGRQELVDRWIKQAHGDRTWRHDPEDFLEVATLHRQEFVECRLTVFGGLGQDHFQHDRQAIGGVEHALGAAQTDTHGAVVGGTLCGFRGVGVGHDLERGDLVGPAQQGTQFRREFRFDGWNRAEIDLTSAAIDGDDIAFMQHFVTDDGLALVDIDQDVFRADHAGLAHATRHYRRVGSLAAATGQDAYRGEKAMNIFWLGFLAHQDNFFSTLTATFLGGVGVEYDLARRRARRGAHALCYRHRLVRGVEPWEQQLFQQFRIDAQQGFFATDQAFIGHFHRSAHHGLGVHLAIAGLQAVEHPFFDGVLVVLHFVVVRFQLVAQLDQLPVHLRHVVLHFWHWLGGADTGYYVFALGVDQVLAVHAVFASTRIAGEAHAGGAIATHVAEHHGHHIDCGTVGHGWSDLEFATVIDGALAHPGVEYRLDRQFQLFVGVLRELPSGLLLNHLQEQLTDFLQISGGERHIDFHPGAALDCFEMLIEEMIVDAQRDLAKQLDETAISVIAETLVTRELDQPIQGGFVQAQVEDGVHHARHRHCGTGAY